MAQITLKVSGMSCMGCVSSVKRLLGQLPGVQSVDVDLATGLVRIDCDSAQVQVPALARAIQDGGYQVVS